jgi:hypothetical protein
MDRVEGLQKANQEGVTVQAWKAGPETVLLWTRLPSC